MDPLVEAQDKTQVIFIQPRWGKRKHGIYGFQIWYLVNNFFPVQSRELILNLHSCFLSSSMHFVNAYIVIPSTTTATELIIQAWYVKLKEFKEEEKRQIFVGLISIQCLNHKNFRWLKRRNLLCIRIWEMTVKKMKREENCWLLRRGWDQSTHLMINVPFPGRDEDGGGFWGEKASSSAGSASNLFWKLHTRNFNRLPWCENYLYYFGLIIR